MSTASDELSITSDAPMNYPSAVNEAQTTTDSIYKVIRRNGSVTPFDASKIEVALTKAFLEVEGGVVAASSRVHQEVKELASQVKASLFRRMPEGGVVHIEDVQDQVELALMRAGEQKVARSYILYREERSRLRAEKESKAASKKGAAKKDILHVVTATGERKPLDEKRLKKVVKEAVAGLSGVNADVVLAESMRNLFDGISEKDVGSALVMSTRVMIEKDPNYSQVAARLLMDSIRREALSLLNGRATEATAAEMKSIYPEMLGKYIRKAAELELVDDELTRYDLVKLGAAIKSQRDLQFTYLGLQTLYDRYFVHVDGVRFELPQIFFMRVAMGLAINEVDREARAIEFYDLLSSFNFMSSTPTLFNSGTLRPQLSSCYLTTVPDHLSGIYDAIKDNALLSKYAGGLGNDWTAVRGLGSHIKGTNGKSQGVVPFLKVANDTAVAVNQGGKRKGAVCAYLETWHIDIEEFIELRKNTGDDRRRTHDMNSANWIPDLFMKRVAEEGEWTLFSPDDTPDLHDLSGLAFEAKYKEYEAKAARGEIKLVKTIKAIDLWRKMLGMLFETGHPWITFKDPCNIRYTNQHVGVVHSSNLCTEITLHTNEDEIAVCNLGSINIAAHTKADGIDMKMLKKTVTTAMRMLDNVIDYNYYSVPQARRSNLQHRPVGMGLMGFHDALYKQDLVYASEAAIQFADESMEAISYFAITASNELAKERGAYPSFKGSLWDRGILPIDSLELLQEARGENYLQIDKSTTLDWDKLRKSVKEHGMRNSNVMAIAPTATISNICGVSQSIEPTYQNLYVKSNLSGEFTVVNPYMVEELKGLGLWDEVMINDLKYFDGSLQQIDRIPANVREKYASAFEIDPRWLVEAGSRRQKWIDQGQSLNLYMSEPSGAKMDNLYKLAWVRGLKTTYYLRSMGATAMEKSSDEPVASTRGLTDNAAPKAAPSACSILDPECEACQ